MRELFPGNRIPRNRLDPVAARLLGFLPQPNLPGTGLAQVNHWVFAPTNATTKLFPL